MTNLKEIKCKNSSCDILFSPKSPKNVFCSRRCFKKSYYHQKKAEELSNKKFPTFICPSCRDRIILDFDPFSEEGSEKWLSFKCPRCNVLMINVSEEIVTQDISI